MEDSGGDVELPAESVIAISHFLLDLKVITT